MHGHALADFLGKFVLGFSDNNSAGRAGIFLWEGQLRGIVGVFDDVRRLRDEGQPIKDARDFLRVDIDQREGNIAVRHPFGTFISQLNEEGKIYG
jgi:hypothetical protein